MLCTSKVFLGTANTQYNSLNKLHAICSSNFSHKYRTLHINYNFLLLMPKTKAKLCKESLE